MTLQQIYDAAKGHNTLIAIAVVLLLSCVEVSKIKINPWSWLFGKIGALCNHTIAEKLNDMGKELATVKGEVAALKADSAENRAFEARSKILWFGDELRNGIRHSQDNYRHIFLAVKLYENYTNQHPEFENGITAPTISFIRETYAQCLKRNDFL